MIIAIDLDTQISPSYDNLFSKGNNYRKYCDKYLNLN